MIWVYLGSTKLLLICPASSSQAGVSSERYRDERENESSRWTYAIWWKVILDDWLIGNKQERSQAELPGIQVWELPNTGLFS